MKICSACRGLIWKETHLYSDDGYIFCDACLKEDLENSTEESELLRQTQDQLLSVYTYIQELNIKLGLFISDVESRLEALEHKDNT